MKKILFIAILFLFSCAPKNFTYIYPTKNKPEIKDKVIVIYSEDNATTNFKEFGKYLVSKGYIIESSSKEFFTFSTKGRMNNYKNDHKFNVSCIEKKIIIRPEVNISAVQIIPIWEQWQYAEKENNSNLKAFKVFFPIILGYSKDVEFLKN